MTPAMWRFKIRTLHLPRQNSLVTFSVKALKLHVSKEAPKISKTGWNAVRERCGENGQIIMRSDAQHDSVAKCQALMTMNNFFGKSSRERCYLHPPLYICHLRGRCRQRGRGTTKWRNHSIRLSHRRRRAALDGFCLDENGDYRAGIQAENLVTEHCESRSGSTLYSVTIEKTLCFETYLSKCLIFLQSGW